MLELEQELIDVRHQIDLLELRFSRLALEFTMTDVLARYGDAAPIDWLRFNCHMTGPAAYDRVNVARQEARLSESIESMRAGEIGFAHLLVLARTAEHLDEKFDEKELLQKARENSPGKLRDICWKYWHAKDPEGFAYEQAQKIEDRRLRLSSWEDGGLTLSGVLDPVGGAALRSALEPLAKPLGPDDKREREQRLADALVELASGGEQKAQIQVTATVETLIGLAGSEAADVDYTEPVSSETVQRLACDSNITRVLFDSESVVFDIGRNKRTVQPQQRRALEARDRGCVWPGCNRTSRWCAAHHLVHWAHGGKTDLENLVLLCHRHHVKVHEHGWQIARTGDRRILTIPPPIRFNNPWRRGPDQPQVA